MDIRVLGPLEAHEDGKTVLPSASKPRQILALLAINSSRAITVATLMEEIWGDHIPRSAATTLQTYILQLRRKIGAALADDPFRDAKDVLVTCHGGYLLDLQPGDVDVDEFSHLTGAGKSAYQAGDHATASTMLGKALDLWRGPALVDVTLGRMLELEVLRLNESRMAALERRIDADLHLGRHSELVPELRVLVARQPLHESFCAQLMTALARSEGAWRALEAFSRLRQSLVDELGLEPSPRLRRIQQAILNGDTDLDFYSTTERVAA